MKFVATFGHWIDEEETGPVPKSAFEDLHFLVEEESFDRALTRARQYEWLETHSFEGIGAIVSLRHANSHDVARITPITIYDEYLRLARQARENQKLRSVN